MYIIRCIGGQVTGNNLVYYPLYRRSSQGETILYIIRCIGGQVRGNNLVYYPMYSKNVQKKGANYDQLYFFLKALDPVSMYSITEK